MIIKEYYEYTIQMIKDVGVKMTNKEYDEFAKKYNLLSRVSLEYISGKKFKKLNKQILKSMQ